MQQLKYIGIAFLLVLVVSCKHDSISIGQLLCESQLNPLSVTAKQPALSWQLQSAGYNVSQSAYQILVASSEDELTNNNGDVWSSGKIMSDQNLYIDYAGQPLVPGTKYYWKVQVWGENGAESSWSPIATFRMAPAIDTSAIQWIGAITKANSNLPEGRKFHTATYKRSKREAMVAATDSLARRSIYLRKEFKVTKTIKEAVVYISGLGHYELTINGKKIGNSEFAPLWTDYDKTVLYNTYELKPSDLENGTNAIGVCLGNGMYNMIAERYSKFFICFGPPTLFYQMQITYTDGSTTHINSDSSWKYSKSPITFNSLFGGEDYDARLEQPGWNTSGFNEADWQPVVLQEAPKGMLTAQETQAVSVHEQFPVALVTEPNDSTMVFNMKQNLSGFPTIKVKGKKGQTVRVWLGEGLKDDGTIGQGRSGKPYYLDYTLKGEGIEEWHPKFTYYGYQYIQIENVNYKEETNKELPTVVELTSNFVYNSASKTASFNSSNTIFNKAHELIDNSIKSNFQSVFTDCPHREKLGWLEETHLNGPGLFYNYDLKSFMPQVMRNIKDAQYDNGMIPTIAPEYVIFGGDFTDSPEWGVAGVIVPWMYYEYYGDASLLKKYYPVMKRYVDYMTSTADNYILDYGLGDWYDYGEHAAGYSKNSPIALSATSHYYFGADVLAKTAKLLDNTEDFKTYTELSDKIRKAFNDTFFNTETKQYGTGSQFSNAVPIFMGIVASEYKDAVLQNLVADIKAHGNRLTTGDVGNRYLYQVLAGNNANELLYKMHNHYEAPGYGSQIQFGLTTLSEQWDPRKGNSWNHFMLGQIEEWFYRSLAGIVPDEEHPGFKHFGLEPQVVGDMTFVNASYESVYGTIVSNWKIEAGVFTYTIEIPVNTTATVVLPKQVVSDIKINDKAPGAYGVSTSITSGTGFTLGSGKYTVTGKL